MTTRRWYGQKVGAAEIFRRECCADQGHAYRVMPLVLPLACNSRRQHCKMIAAERGLPLPSESRYPASIGKGVSRMDALPYYAKYMALHPCRTLDWRWQRAQRLIEQHQYVTRGRDDALTAHAVRYLRNRARRRRASAEVGNQFSATQEAHQLYLEGGQTKLVIEARVLACQSVEEIARLTSVPADVVHSFEGLFFACRPYLTARDWIVAHAIIRDDQAEPTTPSRGQVLKSFAFAGGPVVLETVLPYLLDNRDVFDPPLDLTTAQGRLEQRVRLAVAAALLPPDTASEKKLIQIMLLVREFEARRPILSAPRSVLAQNIDLLAADGLLEVNSSGVTGTKTPSVAVGSETDTKMAQAG